MTHGHGAAALVALMLAGCAAGADRAPDDTAELAAVLAGRTAGTPRRCIALPQTSSPQIVGERLIYRDGRRLWVSETVGGCPSLRGDAIPVFEVQGAELCENDRFRTIQRGSSIPGPYCRFGPFVPFEQAPS